jgi:hypothetical protein
VYPQVVRVVSRCEIQRFRSSFGLFAAHSIPGSSTIKAANERPFALHHQSRITISMKILGPMILSTRR